VSCAAALDVIIIGVSRVVARGESIEKVEHERMEMRIGIGSAGGSSERGNGEAALKNEGSLNAIDHMKYL
jgi:hypothetical protein